MYFRITSAVTLSPTVRTKYSSSQNSPPHNCFRTSGNSSRISLALTAFSTPPHGTDRVPRRKTQKQMHLILVDLQFLHLKSVMRRNLAKQLPHSLPNRPPQHPFPILGCPDQMVAGVVHTVAAASDGHALLYRILAASGSTHFSPPPFRAGNPNASFRKF